MKKVIDILLLVLIFFIVYFLQSNFFIWFNIAGVMPNLFVILIMLIGFFIKKNSGFIFGIIFGLLLDLFIGFKFGLNAVSLGVVGIVTNFLDKNFSKDNRITIMFLTCILTVVSESVFYILQILFCGANIELFEFAKIVIIEMIYNALLIAIIYPFFLYFGDKFENDFTDKSFLKF